MAGIVYLKTNRFEVKLEGITFKAKEFESLFTADILFPEGKTWAQPPVVGIDVMRHPRDPKIILVLLCFGVGCVILRFHSGEQLPDPFLKFLTDKRIRFVGFAIPEKKDLFPFEKLGLTKDKVDIGYLATKFFNDPKYKRYELGDLARKVLGIKKMIGLTQASSFERHEQIKCAICQLFISSVMAMTLFTTKDKKKLAEAPKKSSFLKNLSLPLEGWFKLPKAKKGDKFHPVQTSMDNLVQTTNDEDFLVTNIVHAAPKHEEAATGYDLIHAKVTEDTFCDDIGGVWGGNNCGTYDDRVQLKCSEVNLQDVSPRVRGGEVDYGDDLFRAKVIEDKLGDGSTCDKAKEVTNINDDAKKEAAKAKEVTPNDDSKKEAVCLIKRPLKGILKCPSYNLDSWNAASSNPDSPVSMDKDEQSVRGSLRRANSKGFNVKFK